MVKATVVYSCGCTYRTDDPVKAIEHVKMTKHTVAVTGEIRNTDKPSSQG